MTRAKTTITQSSTKPSSASSRKTAAGLLITATAKAKPASASKSSTTRTSGAAAATSSTTATAVVGGSSSPKQQRISLVARQSMFANENKNPNRKLNRVDTTRPSRPATAPSGGKGDTAGDVNRNSTNPAGSNTSLSSGSSSRSWAGTVRAGLGLTHLSVEDLSLNL